MKKFILIFLFSSTLSTQPMSKKLKRFCIPLSKLRLKKLRSILGMRFGKYNPAIRYIKDSRTHIVKKNPTLFLHGFRGDNKQVHSFYSSQCIVGDTITLDLPGATKQGEADFSRTSFGQENDVYASIYALKTAKTCGVVKNAVDIYGYSRGAGTAGNMIHVLAKPSKKQSKKLLKIGVDAQKRKKLLKTIQHGNVILDRPLVNVRTCVQAIVSYNVNNHVKKPLSKIDSTLLQKLLKSNVENIPLATLSLSVDLLLTLVTYFNYSPLGINLWDSSDTIRNHNIPLLIHVDVYDNVVSNVYDQKLYARIRKYNPKTYISIGNDGGHQCDPHSLVSPAHLFKKEYNGSFDPTLLPYNETLSGYQPRKNDVFKIIDQLQKQRLE